MPTLDEKGHIPQDVLDKYDWTAAAVICGVDPADLEDRRRRAHRLHDLDETLAEAVNALVCGLCCELELLPWTDSKEDLQRMLATARDRWAGLVAECEQVLAETGGVER
ncbi:MAG: hypothetical protein JW940_18755 [Polyangiaceae bacterium]|nr:hypothetical protein [Polyangiaceae bacterium]